MLDLDTLILAVAATLFVIAIGALLRSQTWRGRDGMGRSAPQARPYQAGRRRAPHHHRRPGRYGSPKPELGDGPI